MQTSGELREEKGRWLLHWEGLDIPVPKEDVAGLRAQVTVPVRTSDLLDSPLDWATARALGYTPTLQGQSVDGTLLDGGILTPPYYNCYVVAYFRGREHFGQFRPSSDPRQSSPIFDAHRISMEVAGDGWAALLNDCFDARTWAKSIKAENRVVAGLRCLVNNILGPVVDVPVELVAPEIRLKAVRSITAEI